jgi:hypothetical protein
MKKITENLTLFFDFTSMNVQNFIHFNIIQIQQHDYPTWQKITKMQKDNESAKDIY